MKQQVENEEHSNKKQVQMVVEIDLKDNESLVEYYGAVVALGKVIESIDGCRIVSVVDLEKQKVKLCGHTGNCRCMHGRGMMVTDRHTFLINETAVSENKTRHLESAEPTNFRPADRSGFSSESKKALKEIRIPQDRNEFWPE